MKEKRGKREKGKKKKVSLSGIILVLILLAGLSLLLYPSVSNWWNSFHQSRAVAAYVEAVASMSQEEKDAIIQAARDYNKRLAKEPTHFELSPEELAEYNSLLDPTGIGIMGYLQIPSIHVKMPVYHTTDELVLQISAGHLTGTSLPVGGKTTHAVVSGHRGLPSARLFTDIDKLTEGDVFTFTFLDETITYQIDQIRTVLPEETSELTIQKGKDYFTLVTCTPYGVNTHRMLVRGHRIANLAGELLNISDARKIPTFLATLAVGIPLMFIVLLIMLFVSRRRVPTGDQVVLEYQKSREAEWARRKAGAGDAAPSGESPPEAERTEPEPETEDSDHNPQE